MHKDGRDHDVCARDRILVMRRNRQLVGIGAELVFDLQTTPEMPARMPAPLRWAVCEVSCWSGQSGKLGIITQSGDLLGGQGPFQPQVDQLVSNLLTGFLSTRILVVGSLARIVVPFEIALRILERGCLERVQRHGVRKRTSQAQKLEPNAPDYG